MSYALAENAAARVKIRAGTRKARKHRSWSEGMTGRVGDSGGAVDSAVT